MKDTSSKVQADLIKKALAVRERAYAPYSKFLVGAALMTDDGQMFVGCNVENASYGLTICAERAVVFAAVAAGQRKLAYLALASVGGVAPCGACRQVLAEFAPDLTIWLVDAKRPKKIVEGNLWDLLPGRFTLAPQPAEALPPPKPKKPPKWDPTKFDT